ncbi:MAG: hypothetical protein KC496_00705 [Anaerolineae bacterium]|nr:hypothetical protein [Anaerolineae bacterium]
MQRFTMLRAAIAGLITSTLGKFSDRRPSPPTPNVYRYPRKKLQDLEALKLAAEKRARKNAKRVRDAAR